MDLSFGDAPMTNVRIVDMTGKFERTVESLASFFEPLSRLQTRLGEIPGSGYVEHYIIFVAIGLFLLLIVPAFARQRSKSVWSSLFPKSIYTHRSSRTDIVLAVVSVLMAFPLTAMLSWLTADSIQALWRRLLPHHDGIVLSQATTIFLQFSVIYLAQDFASFFRHYLSHKVPVLWAFHRVHHSAEVLTPLTGGARRHPVDFLWEFLTVPWLSGVLIGTVFFACGMKVDATAGAMLTALGFVTLLYLPFSHSHIWISFGRLNRFIMSPCMHIVHHGALLKHRDKNMGGGLALWDWLFGTLYVPIEREIFPLGINLDERGERNPHNSAVGVLVEPFVQFIHIMTAKTPLAGPEGSHVHVILSDGTHATLDRRTEALVTR
jgi:sterol desaturase/sphingolipid hydroxylase (fatty acid hydroxylase superfamily)